jgi:hypothetical protein
LASRVIIFCSFTGTTREAQEIDMVLELSCDGLQVLKYRDCKVT